MRFIHSETALTIEFQGLEQCWALKRKFNIPKEHIADLLWHEHIEIPFGDIFWRVGGTATGFLFAGRFWGKAGKEFLYISRSSGWFRSLKANHVLEIVLREERYKRMYFSVHDQVVAQRLLTWYRQR